jgi:molybdopterin-binding protein
MPRKDQGWITFQTSEDERQLLEEICQMSQRTKTEVLRELVRGLRYATPGQLTEVEEPLAEVVPGKATAKRSKSSKQKPSIPSKKPLKVSSRNVLQGKVKRIVSSSVNTEVTLEIVHVVELTSVITTTSAQELGLAEGKDAYAVIKSNDVVIAME